MKAKTVKINRAEADKALPKKTILPVRADVKEITYHRNPTPSEIKFGHGCQHYKDFPIDICTKKTENGLVLKKRIKCKIDGLIYTR